MFCSKWANYSYREQPDRDRDGEWLHDAQLGAWRMLREHGLPCRIICEDNLDEPELSKYRGIYVAFSPPQLMPQRDRDRLAGLCDHIPAIIDVELAPENAGGGTAMEFGQDPEAGRFPITAPGLPRWGIPKRPLLGHGGRRVTLGFPLAYVWLHGTDRPACERVLGWAMDRSWGR